MTRWVRSGNTQKHKKMPGDATKWGEFEHQKNNESSPKKKKMKRESSFGKSKDCNDFDSPSGSNTNSTENNELSLMKQETNFSTPSNKAIGGNELKNCSVTDSKNEDVDNKNVDTSSAEKKKGDKEKYLKKLQKKRAENGILLLPSKIERKLYCMKKKLRGNGVPPHLLKEVIRKERRKAELNFRKTFNPSKLCFHCRKPGHMLANCPEKMGSSTQETGICFKCGSAEHTSFKCPEKIQGFPFAKCFICKEQGHISKDCSKNKRGVYPKGGRCNLCGNVNHLRKDCPSLSKQITDELSITLHTIEEESSIDAEVKKKVELKKGNLKKTKIVKF